MKRSVKSISSLLIIALLGLMSMNMVACSSSDSNNNAMGPQTNPQAQALAGVYESNYRWGGQSGAWRGPVTLTINVDGSVYYGSTEIINPIFAPKSLSWTIADGNKNQASVTFQDSDNRAYYWSDKGSVSKQNFTGWLQNPGEGKLDYRGLIK